MQRPDPASADDLRPAKDGEPRHGADADDTTVLELFGLRLTVANPRLAEILLMDAKQALTTDVRDLADPGRARATIAEAAEAVPEVIVAIPTVRDADEHRSRVGFRERVEEVGAGLGFTVSPDGTWASESGLRIAVRPVDRDVSLAAAADFIAKLEYARSTHGTFDSGLIVTAMQQDADDFALAIRQARLFHAMRTVSVENLDRIRWMHASGALTHRQAAALLSPVFDADVGELVALLGPR